MILKGINEKKARINFTLKSATARLIQYGRDGPKPSKGTISFAHLTSFPGSIKLRLAENATVKKINVSILDPIRLEPRGLSHQGWILILLKTNISAN